MKSLKLKNGIELIVKRVEHKFEFIIKKKEKQLTSMFIDQKTIGKIAEFFYKIHQEKDSTSNYYDRYISLYKELFPMIYSDSDEANSIRDKLDHCWKNMTEEEQDRADDFCSKHYE